MHTKHTTGCSKNDLTLVLGFRPDRVGPPHKKHTSRCCKNDLTLALGFAPDKHIKHTSGCCKIDCTLVLGFILARVGTQQQDTPVGVARML